MTYQQEGHIAILKRVAGWIIFIPAFLSTIASLMNFLFTHSDKHPGISAVLIDFIHVFIDMVRFNTPFLDFFWQNSPDPDFGTGFSVMFWGIYLLMFIGLALQASGARMWRQSRYLKEKIEDQFIMECAKGEEGLSRQDLAARIVVPRNSFLRQIFLLYVLPVVIALIGYFFLDFIGLI